MGPATSDVRGSSEVATNSDTSSSILGSQKEIKPSSRSRIDTILGLIDEALGVDPEDDGNAP
jgi:hypothetical protein